MSSCNVDTLPLPEKIKAAINDLPKDIDRAVILNDYLKDVINDRNKYIKEEIKVKKKEVLLKIENLDKYLTEDPRVNFYRGFIESNIKEEKGKKTSTQVEEYLDQVISDPHKNKDLVTDLLKNKDNLIGHYTGTIRKVISRFEGKQRIAEEVKKAHTLLNNALKSMGSVTSEELKKLVPKAYRHLISEGTPVADILKQMKSDYEAYLEFKPIGDIDNIAGTTRFKDYELSLVAKMNLTSRAANTDTKLPSTGVIENIRNLPILGLTPEQLKEISKGNFDSVKDLFKDNEPAKNVFKLLLEKFFKFHESQDYKGKDRLIKSSGGNNTIYNGITYLSTRVPGFDGPEGNNFALPIPFRILAFKAALEWLATSSTLRYNDNDTINDSFLLNTKRVKISKDIYSRFRHVGSLRSVAERQIGAKIYNQLGITLKDSIFDVNKFSDEILKNSLGQYAIQQLISAGLLVDIYMPTGINYLKDNFKKETAFNVENAKERGSYFKHFIKLNTIEEVNGDIHINMPEDGHKNIDEQKSIKELITSEAYSDMESLLLGKREVDIRIRTEPPVDVTVNSPEAALNDFNHGVQEAVDTINIHQKTPYELNQPFNDLVDAIGASESNVEALAELLGHTPLEGKFKGLHEQLEGQNLSIRAALDSYFEFKNALTKQGISEFYFRFRTWMMGRIGAAPDTANPQIYKWHREAFTAKDWKRTVDPSDTEMMDLFKVGIAASLIKDINKMTMKEFIEAFDNYVETNKDKLDKLLVDYKAGVPNLVLQDLKELGIDSPAKFNGIAQLLNYLKSPNKPFDVILTVEIDATTSGTTIGILSAIHDKGSASGYLGRIGVYEEGVGENRLIDYKKTGYDTYETVGINAGQVADTWFKTKPDSLAAINELITNLFKLERSDTNKIIVNSELRDLAKSLTNPVQYGSGPNPLNYNIGDYLIDKINAQIQKIQDSVPEEDRYSKLKEIGNILDRIVDSNYFSTKIKDAGSFENFFDNFTWSTFDITTINKPFTTKQGKQTYGSIIKEHIDQHLGPIADVRKNVITLSNGINDILTYVFNKIIKQEEANGTIYTNKKRKELLDKLLPIRPLLPSLFTGTDLNEYIDNTKYDGIAPSSMLQLSENNKTAATSLIQPHNNTVKNGNFRNQTIKDLTVRNPVTLIQPLNISARPGPFAIQSIDSSAMYMISKEANKQGISFYPIHDAEVITVFDLQKMADISNKAYADIMYEHNPLQKLYEYYSEYRSNLEKVLKEYGINTLEGMTVDNFFSLDIQTWKKALQIEELRLAEETEADIEIEINPEGIFFGEAVQGIGNTADEHRQFVEEIKQKNMIFDIFAQPLKAYTREADTQKEESTSEDLQRIGESIYSDKELDKNLYDAIKQELQRLFPSIELRELDKVFDQFGSEVVGRALDQIVEVSTTKQSQDTLPHEYAHVYVSMLRFSKLIQSAIGRIKQAENLTEKDAIEFLVKGMGERFVAEVKSPKYFKYQNMFKNIWTAIKKAFNTKSIQEAFRTYKSEAAISQVFYSFRKAEYMNEVSFIPKKGYVKIDFDKVLHQEELGRDIIKLFNSKIDGIMLTGSLALAPFIDVFRNEHNILHDLDFIIDKDLTKNNEEKLLKESYPGTVKIYDFPVTGGKRIKTYIVPPLGYKIGNVTRINPIKNLGRVLSYDVLDSNNKVVNTYTATVSRKRVKEEGIIGFFKSFFKTILEKEDFSNESGIKPKMIDFMYGNKEVTSDKFFSKTLNQKINVADYMHIFKAKYGLGTRPKDITDFNLISNSEIKESILANLPKLGSTTNTDFTGHSVINSTEVTASNLVRVFDSLSQLGNVQPDEEHLAVLKNIISFIGSRLGDRKFDLEQYMFENKNFGEIEDNKVRINTTLNPIFSALNLSAQEIHAHEMIHAITRTLLEKSAYFRNKVRELYNQAAAQLTPEDFLARNPDGSVRIVTDYATELAEAKARYDYIFNNPVTGIHEFVAFGLTNKQVMKALSTLKREVVPTNPDTLFAKLADWFSGLMSLVYDKWTGRGNMQMDQELFSLISAMTDVNQRASDSVVGFLSQGFGFVNQQIGKGFTGIYNWSNVPNPNRVQKTIKVLGSVRTIVNSDPFKFGLATLQDMAVKSQISILKHVAFAIAQLPVEAKGMSEDLSKFKRLVIQSKHEIEALSTQQKLFVVKHLKEAFGDTEVTDNDSISLEQIVVKSDLVALDYSLPDLVKLLKDNRFIEQEINKRLNTLDPQYRNRYERYSKALGHFMITKVSHVEGLLLNADNIADQLFTGSVVEIKNRDAVVKTIDELKSLYALTAVKAEHKTNVIKLIKKEHARNPEINGITTLIDKLADFKDKSLVDLFGNDKTQMQSGYDGEILDDKVDIQFSEDPNDQELIKKGYKQQGELKQNDVSSGPVKYIYVSPYGGQLPWVKGAISFTSKQAFGTEVVPGNLNVQMIIDSINANMDNPNLDYETSYLVPVVSPDKDITGMRYVMSEAHRLKFLNKDQDVFHNLGAMEASYTNKLASEEINKEGFRLLYEDYQKNFSRNPGMYVKLDNDGTYKDFYRMLPYETRKYAHNLFKGDIYIKAELLNMMMGFRELSITGIDKLNKPVFRIAERGLKEVITHLKTNWVIKTPVMINNILSNINAGLFLNIPMDYWVKTQLEGAYLVDEYMAKHKEAISIELKLVSQKRMSEPMKKNLQRKLDILKADIKANPITRYINMGLLSTIVDDVSIQDDIEKFSLKNQVEEYFESTVGNKIPKILKSAWSHLYLTKDHPVYKALYKSTQYSDLVAKYATIKYFTEEKGMSEDAAIDIALDTFIEYDSLTSPLLKYTNDIGLTPFTKYRIRIQKRLWKSLGEAPANSAAVMLVDHLTNMPNVVQGLSLQPLGFAWLPTYIEKGGVLPTVEVAKGMADIIMD